MRLQRVHVWLLAVLSVALLVSSVDVVTDLAPSVSSSVESPEPERSVEGRPVRKVADVRGAEDSPPPAKKASPPVLPGAGSAEVVVGAASAVAGGLLFSVGKAAGAAAVPGRVRVESIGAEAVKRIGGVAAGVRLSRADGGTQAARVRVSVDYAQFVGAFSAGRCCGWG
ncbi:hypothetical protein AB0M95_40880 [Sphaerisporangium sp. NPDC051017]|uniref:hypothetical protein n=1 Tax=Sphaerisporangium sp. NPDC051017 TaxID=3154636 RepID=UPI003414C033